MPYRDGYAFHSAIDSEVVPRQKQIDDLGALLDDIEGLMASHELMLRFDRKKSEDYKEGVEAAHDQIRRMIKRHERGDADA